MNQFKQIPDMMPDKKPSILVVDDEPDLCDILRFNLRTEGYEVTVAYSAEEAMRKDLKSYDLILLDVMMGRISGFDMAESMKRDKETANVPIIFLTAKDAENDVLTGLGLGADDYISKPFSVREVMLRVKAVLRRTAAGGRGPVSDNLTYGGIVLDRGRKSVTVDGQDVPFTRTEYEILQLLLQEKGRVVSRDEIIRRIWPDDVTVLDRTVDVNITRIRKKIGTYADLLMTRSGFGYYFEG